MLDVLLEVLVTAASVLIVLRRPVSLSKELLQTMFHLVKSTIRVEEILKEDKTGICGTLSWIVAWIVSMKNRKIQEQQGSHPKASCYWTTWRMIADGCEAEGKRWSWTYGLDVPVRCWTWKMRRRTKLDSELKREISDNAGERQIAAWSQLLWEWYARSYPCYFMIETWKKGNSLPAFSGFDENLHYFQRRKRRWPLHRIWSGWESQQYQCLSVTGTRSTGVRSGTWVPDEGFMSTLYKLTRSWRTHCCLHTQPLWRSELLQLLR